jgi:BirA family transcriptional regulator, biotin operon repressor / biotin---[acetyl-CoA-carboxylase] ligase
VPLSAATAMGLNIPLLDRLRAADGDYVPLRELGPDLEQVRFDLDALLSFGFGIEQHPYLGAAYVGPAQRLCPDQIEHGLLTGGIGRRIAVWNRVTSTNDLAMRAGTSSSNDGLVIFAEEQTAGRGRRGRSWMAPPFSSILMSVVLFPPAHPACALPEAGYGRPWLTALGAVAAAEVVTAWTGRHATIKWPNDVRIGGRKIAGILVERAFAPGRPGTASPARGPAAAEWGAVIGIGLNVNLNRDDLPAELISIATSLEIEGCGSPIDRSEVARHLIRRLDHWYQASRCNGVEVLNLPWRTRSEHLGRFVRITTSAGAMSGRLVEIDLRTGLTLSVADDAPRRSSEQGMPQLVRLSMGDVLTLEEVSIGLSEHDPSDVGGVGVTMPAS